MNSDNQEITNLFDRIDKCSNTTTNLKCSNSDSHRVVLTKASDVCAELICDSCNLYRHIILDTRLDNSLEAYLKNKEQLSVYNVSFKLYSTLSNLNANLDTMNTVVNVVKQIMQEKELDFILSLKIADTDNNARVEGEFVLIAYKILVFASDKSQKISGSQLRQDIKSCLYETVQQPNAINEITLKALLKNLKCTTLFNLTSKNRITIVYQIKEACKNSSGLMVDAIFPSISNPDELYSLYLNLNNKFKPIIVFDISSDMQRLDGEYEQKALLSNLSSLYTKNDKELSNLITTYSYLNIKRHKEPNGDYTFFCKECESFMTEFTYNCND